MSLFIYFVYVFVFLVVVSFQFNNCHWLLLSDKYTMVIIAYREASFAEVLSSLVNYVKSKPCVVCAGIFFT